MIKFVFNYCLECIKVCIYDYLIELKVCYCKFIIGSLFNLVLN